MTDLEASARELLEAILVSPKPNEDIFEYDKNRISLILAFARSVAADAREEALREAAAACDFTVPAAGGASRQRCLNAIRALLRAEPRDG